MHGLMSYRCFGRARSLRTDRALARARSLRSDRAEWTLGRYLYLGNIRCDVLLIEHDLLRKDILVFCGDLDINFVVIVFDPNNAARKVEATNLQRAEHKAERQVEKRADNKLTKVKLEESTEIELSPYDKLPFPQRVLTKAQKKVLSRFRKDLSDVGVRLPEISGMREAHVQMMLIKDILDHQAEVAELLDISILKIDPPIPPKSLPKIKSQGMFTLPCYLGKLTFDDALVDSGASVNVISMEMMKSLGIESMEPNTSSLQFGDSSSTTPFVPIEDQ
ncbi:hypothetical protein F2Q68_00009890 [Brassica cretica]|uniref:Aspartic peptidase DDI1-type domain-containing protein n=1 Tax=Brassica cretica TaxID=69181 RepID=A0A8S9KXG0_BRACR|nr:hypothetical protein F2Q68_00009890 [Brassica cretica]